MLKPDSLFFIATTCSTLILACHWTVVPVHESFAAALPHFNLLTTFVHHVKYTIKYFVSERKSKHRKPAFQLLLAAFKHAALERQSTD